MPENSLFSSSRQKNGIRSINSRYTLLPSLGVQLSGEVPFIISEWLVWELPPDNQRVSNWLFERSPIIIVVGWLNFLGLSNWNFGTHNWETSLVSVFPENAWDGFCKMWWVWNDIQASQRPGHTYEECSHLLYLRTLWWEYQVNQYEDSQNTEAHWPAGYALHLQSVRSSQRFR